MSAILGTSLRFDSRSTLNSRNRNSAATLTYALFALAAFFVVTWVTDGDFSAVLTASVSMQCLGLLQLYIQVWYRKSACGVSLKSMELFTLVFAARLFVTSFKNGYLPVDSTGDHIHQFADVLSLVLSALLVYSLRVTHKHTYLRESDTMPSSWILPASIVMAMCVHAHLNHSFFWDTTWFVSLYLETFALLPQLWMMTKIGGEVEGMTAHFVACTAASKALAWIVWYVGYGELAVGYMNIDGSSEGTTNWGGYAIMFSYTAQVVMCADFAYHYVAAVIADRKMLLPVASV